MLRAKLLAPSSLPGALESAWRPRVCLAPCGPEARYIYLGDSIRRKGDGTGCTVAWRYLHAAVDVPARCRAASRTLVCRFHWLFGCGNGVFKDTRVRRPARRWTERIPAASRAISARRLLSRPMPSSSRSARSGRATYRSEAAGARCREATLVKFTIVEGRICR